MTPPTCLEITLPLATGPMPVTLFAMGALYWAVGQTLFIADPHFGKAATFHQAGIAIPEAVHSYDLARLTHLLDQTQAARLIILGDFFHTHHSRTSTTMFEALLTWREQHAGLEITLVAGNHDRHAGAPPLELGIDSCEAPFALSPFICLHEPMPMNSLAQVMGYALAGHLHPRARLRDRDGSQVHLPCFWVSPSQMVLPAFGSFTGGSTIRPTPRDRVFVIAGDYVMEAPQPRPHRR
jgi:uncharacterized protein